MKAEECPECDKEVIMVAESWIPQRIIVTARCRKHECYCTCGQCEIVDKENDE